MWCQTLSLILRLFSSVWLRLVQNFKKKRKKRIICLITSEKCYFFCGPHMHTHTHLSGRVTNIYTSIIEGQQCVTNRYWEGVCVYANALSDREAGDSLTPSINNETRLQKCTAYEPNNAAPASCQQAWVSALESASVCMHSSSEEVMCVSGFICLLMFVFCVCLTAVVLSGLFANMFVHEQQQACRNEWVIEMQREGEACQAMLRQMVPVD